MSKKTKEIAKRKRKNTTKKDIPGKGMAKKAAEAIEKRKKMLKSI
jgi:hypothetical protein